MEIEKPIIFNLDLPDLQKLVLELNEPVYRSTQLWQGLYQNYWQSPIEFTTLPLHFKNLIFEILSFTSLKPIRSITSGDRGTVKTLFQLQDGNTIESVLMLYNKRNTLCISTQAGCGMGCVFCATGQMGYKRNLTSGEIVEQVLFFARLLRDRNALVTNVVIMGMGEPFNNYDATLSAIDRLNDADGFNLGARRFTISTVGIIPKIIQFADEKRQINLAISLHSGRNELRSSLLPINNKYPVEELINACRYYVDQTRRRISFEWALIDGVNDSPRDAAQLAILVKGLLCHVNVIPLNPTQKYKGQPPGYQKVEDFCAELTKAGVPSTIRLRRGIEIQAGCGQLASNELP